MTRTKPTTSLRSVPGWLLLVLLVSLSLLFSGPAAAAPSSLAQRRSSGSDGVTISYQDERELNKENSTVFDDVMNATMTAASSQGSPEGNATLSTEGNATMSTEHQTTPVSGSSKGGGGGKGGSVKGDSSTSSYKTGGTKVPGGAAAKLGKGKGGKGGDGSSSSSKMGYGTITTGAPLESSAPTASIAPNGPYYSKKWKESKDSKKSGSKDSKKGPSKDSSSKDSSSKKDIKGTSSKTDKSLKGKGKGKGGASSTMVPTSSGELTMGT